MRYVARILSSALQWSSSTVRHFTGPKWPLRTKRHVCAPPWPISLLHTQMFLSAEPLKTKFPAVARQSTASLWPRRTPPPPRVQTLLVHFTLNDKPQTTRHVILVSAKHGQGVEDVKQWILSKLPFGPAYYPKDIVSEHPERFFVSEIVREKIFMQCRKEIPYACQVNVVSYKSRPAAKDFIQLEIVVEKNSQRITLIGKLHVRLDIEDFLQEKVFLEVEVKVKENWRQDEVLLKNNGYGGQIQAL
ncbi:hypothetical protein ACLB2K_024767 [Fragaria x ananassa]